MLKGCNTTKHVLYSLPSQCTNNIGVTIINEAVYTRFGTTDILHGNGMPWNLNSKIESHSHFTFPQILEPKIRPRVRKKEM